MAEDNIKGFTIQWALVGLLLVSLLSFTMFFLANNGTEGLGDGINGSFNSYLENSKSNLVEINVSANELLNITAKTDPEVSQLGSRDSVATAYGYREEGVGNWDKFKVMVAFVFSGDTGKVVLSVLGGLIGYLSVYYIIKFIRTGF